MIASLRNSLKSLLARLRDPHLENSTQEAVEQSAQEARVIALLQEKISLQERKIQTLVHALERCKAKQPIRRARKPNNDPA